MKRVAALLTVLLFTAGTCSGQRIRSLLTGQVDPASNPLLKWFSEEPLVEGLFVPTRPGGIVGTAEIRRFVRIYFPRSYEGVKTYDFIMLHSPVMYHFTDTQARWMFDAIGEGAGSLSAPACMSMSPDIYNAWIASILSQALPNDCAAVIEAGGPKGNEAFRIRVNRDFPEPVLTPFIPLGIETFVGSYAYMIIPKEAAMTMAWQIGGFRTEVPYMATWQYENGRTMTLGDSFGLAFWSSYSGKGTSQNPYSLDILMNMVLYLVKREVPTEVLVFHRMRMSFMEFRTRMSLLVSLMEFAQRFGASSQHLEKILGDLEAKYSEARDLYLAEDFVESEEVMKVAFEDFGKAEDMVRKLKERALFWIYMVEWLVTTATLMISGFVLWTLMIRRKLYQEVRATRMESREEDHARKG